MANELVTNEQSVSTTSVLANAIELGTEVLMAVAGNSIGNAINGELVTPVALQPIVAAKLQKGLARYMTSSTGL